MAFSIAHAEETADQIERAQLLRELDQRQVTAPRVVVKSLPGASVNITAPVTATDSLRRQQFADTQWRTLIGSQQMQANAPPSQAIPQTQWRAQIYQRDSQAEALSADILRRSRAATAATH
ncbi:MAG: hypothetical protein ABI771_17875 [Betaproteobacteria bacterium]